LYTETQKTWPDPGAVQIPTGDLLGLLSNRSWPLVAIQPS